jgi:regulator of sirC expression with transglutaminase-like and TPR domain
MGDFKMALSFYDQGLHLNPKSSYAMYGRGVALSRLGELAAARNQLSAANAADPAIAGVYKQIRMEPAP